MGPQPWAIAVRVNSAALNNLATTARNIEAAAAGLARLRPELDKTVAAANKMSGGGAMRLMAANIAGVQSQVSDAYRRINELDAKLATQDRRIGVLERSARRSPASAPTSPVNEPSPTVARRTRVSPAPSSGGGANGAAPSAGNLRSEVTEPIVRQVRSSTATLVRAMARTRTDQYSNSFTPNRGVQGHSLLQALERMIGTGRQRTAVAAGERGGNSPPRFRREGTSIDRRSNERQELLAGNAVNRVTKSRGWSQDSITRLRENPEAFITNALRGLNVQAPESSRVRTPQLKQKLATAILNKDRYATPEAQALALESVLAAFKDHRSAGNRMLSRPVMRKVGNDKVAQTGGSLEDIITGQLVGNKSSAGRHVTNMAAGIGQLAGGTNYASSQVQDYLQKLSRRDVKEISRRGPYRPLVNDRVGEDGVKMVNAAGAAVSGAGSSGTRSTNNYIPNDILREVQLRMARYVARGKVDVSNPEAFSEKAYDVTRRVVRQRAANRPGLNTPEAEIRRRGEAAGQDKESIDQAIHNRRAAAAKAASDAEKDLARLGGDNSKSPLFRNVVGPIRKGLAEAMPGGGPQFSMESLVAPLNRLNDTAVDIRNAIYALEGHAGMPRVSGQGTTPATPPVLPNQNKSTEQLMAEVEKGTAPKVMSVPNPAASKETTEQEKADAAEAARIAKLRAESRKREEEARQARLQGPTKMASASNRPLSPADLAAVAKAKDPASEKASTTAGFVVTTNKLMQQYRAGLVTLDNLVLNAKSQHFKKRADAEMAQDDLHNDPDQSFKKGKGFHLLDIKEEMEKARRAVTMVSGDMPSAIPGIPMAQAMTGPLPTVGRPGGKQPRSIGSRWLDAATRAGLYGSAATALYGGTSQLTNSVGFMSQWDDATNRIERVMDDGPDRKKNVARLSRSSRDMAKQYGVDMLDVADVAQGYAAQGKGVNDIETLTKTSVLASNVTELTPQAATEALTAATAQFNKTAKDTPAILDAWNEVENKTSVNATVLTKALMASGTAASGAGVSFDEFNGMVGAVGEATRKSGEEIGNSLKFMLQNLRNDNAVESLQDIGIYTTDTSGKMMKATAVLQSVRDKWDTLTEAQKNNLGQSIAGTRHMNDFLVLIDKFNRANEITAIGMKANGSATRENEVAMQTLSKQYAVLKAEAQDFLATIAETGAIDAMTNALKGLQGVVKLLSGTDGGIGGMIGRNFGGVLAGGAVAGIGAYAMANRQPAGIPAGMNLLDEPRRMNRDQMMELGMNAGVTMRESWTRGRMLRQLKKNNIVPQDMQSSLGFAGWRNPQQLAQFATPASQLVVNRNATGHTIPNTGPVAAAEAGGMMGNRFVKGSAMMIGGSLIGSAAEGMDATDKRRPWVESAGSVMQGAGGWMMSGGGKLGMVFKAISALGAISGVVGAFSRQKEAVAAKNAPPEVPAAPVVAEEQSAPFKGEARLSAESVQRLATNFIQSVNAMGKRNEELLARPAFRANMYGIAGDTANGGGAATGRAIIDALDSMRQNDRIERGGVQAMGSFTDNNKSVGQRFREASGRLLEAQNNPNGVSLNGLADIGTNMQKLFAESRSRSTGMLDDYIKLSSRTDLSKTERERRSELQNSIQSSAKDRFGEIETLVTEVGTALREGRGGDSEKATASARSVFVEQIGLDFRNAINRSGELIRGRSEQLVGAQQESISALGQRYGYLNETGKGGSVQSFLAGPEAKELVSLMKGRRDDVGSSLKQARQSYGEQVAAGADAQTLDTAADNVKTLEAAFAALDKAIVDLPKRVYAADVGLKNLNDRLDRVRAMGENGGAFGFSGGNAVKFGIGQLQSEMSRVQKDDTLTPAQRESAVKQLAEDIRAQKRILQNIADKNVMTERGALQSVGIGNVTGRLGLGTNNGMAALLGVEQQRIAEAIEDAFAKNQDKLGNPDSMRAFSEQLIGQLSPMMGNLRLAGMDQDPALRKQMLLATPSDRAAAESVRDMIGQGMSTDDIFGHPLMAKAARENPLMSMMMDESIKSGMNDPAAALKVQQDTNNILQSMPDLLTKLISALGGQASGGGGGVAPTKMSVGSMALKGAAAVDGEGRIRRDGTPAILHEGEIVLNKHQSSAFLENQYATGTLPRGKSLIDLLGLDGTTMSPLNKGDIASEQLGKAAQGLYVSTAAQRGLTRSQAKGLSSGWTMPAAGEFGKNEAHVSLGQVERVGGEYLRYKEKPTLSLNYGMSGKGFDTVRQLAGALGEEAGHVAEVSVMERLPMDMYTKSMPMDLYKKQMQAQRSLMAFVMHTANSDPLLAKSVKSLSMLDDYKPYLNTLATDAPTMLDTVPSGRGGQSGFRLVSEILAKSDRIGAVSGEKSSPAVLAVRKQIAQAADIHKLLDSGANGKAVNAGTVRTKIEKLYGGVIDAVAKTGIKPEQMTDKAIQAAQTNALKPGNFRTNSVGLGRRMKLGLWDMMRGTSDGPLPRGTSTSWSMDGYNQLVRNRAGMLPLDVTNMSSTNLGLMSQLDPDYGDLLAHRNTVADVQARGGFDRFNAGAAAVKEGRLSTGMLSDIMPRRDTAGDASSRDVLSTRKAMARIQDATGFDRVNKAALAMERGQLSPGMIGELGTGGRTTGREAMGWRPFGELTGRDPRFLLPIEQWDARVMGPLVDQPQNNPFAMRMGQPGPRPYRNADAGSLRLRIDAQNYRDGRGLPTAREHPLTMGPESYAAAAEGKAGAWSRLKGLGAAVAGEGTMLGKLARTKLGGWGLKAGLGYAAVAATDYAGRKISGAVGGDAGEQFWKNNVTPVAAQAGGVMTAAQLAKGGGFMTETPLLKLAGNAMIKGAGWAKGLEGGSLLTRGLAAGARGIGVATGIAGKATYGVGRGLTAVVGGGSATIGGRAVGGLASGANLAMTVELAGMGGELVNSLAVKSGLVGEHSALSDGTKAFRGATAWGTMAANQIGDIATGNLGRYQNSIADRGAADIMGGGGAALEGMGAFDTNAAMIGNTLSNIGGSSADFVELGRQAAETDARTATMQSLVRLGQPTINFVSAKDMVKTGYLTADQMGAVSGGPTSAMDRIRGRKDMAIAELRSTQDKISQINEHLRTSGMSGENVYTSIRASLQEKADGLSQFIDLLRNRSEQLSAGGDEGELATFDRVTQLRTAPDKYRRLMTLASESSLAVLAKTSGMGAAAKSGEWSKFRDAFVAANLSLDGTQSPMDVLKSMSGKDSASILEDLDKSAAGGVPDFFTKVIAAKGVATGGGASKIDKAFADVGGIGELVQADQAAMQQFQAAFSKAQMLRQSYLQSRTQLGSAVAQSAAEVDANSPAAILAGGGPRQLAKQLDGLTDRWNQYLRVSNNLTIARLEQGSVDSQAFDAFQALPGAVKSSVLNRLVAGNVVTADKTATGIRSASDMFTPLPEEVMSKDAYAKWLAWRDQAAAKVGQGIPRMAVGSMALAGTPAVDSSGRIRADETPAMLHKGEIVLNRRQSDHLMNNRFESGTLAYASGSGTVVSGGGDYNGQVQSMNGVVVALKQTIDSFTSDMKQFMQGMGGDNAGVKHQHSGEIILKADSQMAQMVAAEVIKFMNQSNGGAGGAGGGIITEPHRSAPNMR